MHFWSTIDETGWNLPPKCVHCMEGEGRAISADATIYTEIPSIWLGESHSWIHGIVHGDP